MQQHSFLPKLEKQTDHRQSLEKIVITGRERRAATGQWMAFILFGLVIVCGFVALFLGYQVTGMIASLAGLAGPLALFFWRRKRSDEDLRRKGES